jgi:hypothetical protein
LEVLRWLALSAAADGLGGLPGVRRSGLGEADARLITVGELDARCLECAADRKFISNSEGQSP